MDIKKASLEEKISKLAEHSKSLRGEEFEDESTISKEKEPGNLEGELVKERMKSAVKESLPSLSKTATSKNVKRKNDEDIIKYLNKADQIKSLVNLSFTRGIFYAVEEARKLDDPYVLDELHDELVKQFKKLVKSGKLKGV